MSIVSTNKEDKLYFYKIKRDISKDLFLKLKYSPQCISYKEELYYRSGLSNSEISELESNNIITFQNIKWKDIPECPGIHFDPIDYKCKTLSGNPYTGKIITI